MILKIQTNWKSFWYSSFLRKFNIKVNNPPPPLSKQSLPFCPTSPFLENIFHPHPYCQIWGGQFPPPPLYGEGVHTMLRHYKWIRRFPVQTPLGNWLDVGTEHHFITPSDIWVTNDKWQWPMTKYLGQNQVSEAAPATIGQSWLWGSHIAYEKVEMFCNIKLNFFKDNHYIILN